MSEIKYKYNNVSLTPRTEAFIERCLIKVERMMGRLGGKQEIWVELGRSAHAKANPNFVKLRIVVKGKTIQAEGEGEDIENAVSVACTRATRELRRYKNRMVDLSRTDKRIAKHLVRFTKRVRPFR